MMHRHWRLSRRPNVTTICLQVARAILVALLVVSALVIAVTLLAHRKTLVVRDCRAA